MVVKSTGVVLATVLILGAGVWILDFAVSGGISALNNAANETEVVTESSSEEEHDHEHDHDEEETTEDVTAE
jgi:ABC-type nickel/cobalt efflux system permease component RcnA